MSGPPLLRERHGHIEVWTLNAPEKRNPLTDKETVDAIVHAAESVNGDYDVRCVILTGAGPAFSAGGNIKDIRAGHGYFGAPPFGAADGYRAGVQRVPHALHHCEVPLIAAVNGPAIGAGCDLALLCDVRIASSTAVFAENFAKLGLISGDGGAWLLPRVVGNARAAEMTLTGESIEATRALEWGLVSRVVEPEALLDTAKEIAQSIAANPPLAVRMSKRLLREGQQQSLASNLELSAPLQAIAHHTDDHREAIAALTEKRTGRYLGK